MGLGGCPWASLLKDPPCSWRLQAELKEKLASTYDVKDQSCIFLFGFRTQVREQWDGASLVASEMFVSINFKEFCMQR